MSLTDAIARAAAAKNETYHVSQGKVEGVDLNRLIARVSFVDGRAIKEVRLAATSSASCVIVPSVKSIVAVAFMENKENRAFIIGWEKIDKIIYAVGEHVEMSNKKGKFFLDKNGIKLGDGTFSILLGEKVKDWALSVDQAITALQAWAGTGVAPGPTGGIAPLMNQIAPEFPDDALSEVNKTS